MVQCSKGHENQDDHGFCAMCGEQLRPRVATESSATPVSNAPPTSQESRGFSRASAAEPPPPGWKPDPANPGQFRWWNGNAWTAHVYREDDRMPQDKSVGVAFALT